MPPFEIIRDTMVYAIMPAALVAGFLLWLGHRLGGAKLAPYAAAVGFIGGAFVGQSLHGELRLAPGESPWNRLPWAALIALVVALALRPLKQPHVGLVIRAVVVAGLVWWFVPPATWHEALWLVALVGLSTFALWIVLEAATARSPGVDVPLSLSLAFAASAIVFVYAGSARLMDAAVVLLAACAGVAVIAWWKRLDVGGMVPAAAVLLSGLSLMTQQETFSEVTLPAFFLPVIAPLGLAATLLFRTWPEKRRQIAGLAIVSIPLIVAAVLAMQAGPLEF